MFLACYLRTDLARYLGFHTSSNWGVYRPEVHVDEVMRLPFPMPEPMDDPRAGWQVVNEVAAILESARHEMEPSFLNRANAVATVSARIEPLINQYFGIHPTEEALIADTVAVVAPSAQPRPELRGAVGLATGTSEQGAAYVERLSATLNRWASSSGHMVRGHTLVERFL